MKRFLTPKTIAILAALMLNTCTWAQSSAVKKSAESVFTLTTFKADGTILSTSHGVFVGNDGEAISNLTPFVGAESAVAIDTKGTKHNVTRIMGVNDIYDVIRFKVDGKTKGAAVATQGATAQQQLWLMPYSNKSAKPVSAKPTSVEKFMDKYNFYIFQLDTPENSDACPFVNEQGQVVGLFQNSTSSSDIHATDAAFASQLTTNALTVNNDTYRKIGITAALPAGKEQATLALMLTQQAGSEKKYKETTEDFLSAYPTLVDGYMLKAQMEINNDNFDAAQKTMETALKNVTDKNEAHYNYAKLMYLKLTYKADKPFAAWTWDTAYNEAQKAYDISPLDIYKDLQGQILFGKGEYAKAYDTFMALTKTSLKNPDLYYNAALCQNELKAPDSVVVALLDSAVNNVDSLNYREAAKYFLMRGDVYNRMQNYRQAVFDYTRYEVVSGGTTNANFYYVREQVEVKGKLFKQALVDIDNAIYLDPKEQVYQAEKASLQLRLNLLKEAEETAKKCISNFPENSDAYLVMGVAQIKGGNKQEGLNNLKKAKEMGNSQADTLIAKYNK